MAAALDGDAHTDACDATYVARDRLFYGVLKARGFLRNHDVVAKLITPSLMGRGPRWPNLRESHHILRLTGDGSAQTGTDDSDDHCHTRNKNHNEDRPQTLIPQDRVIIVSDGLSDPCDGGGLPRDPRHSGFGLEVLTEFTDSSYQRDGSISYAARFDPERVGAAWVRRWEVLVTDTLTNQIAGMGHGIHGYMDRWGGVVSADVRAGAGLWTDPDSAPHPEHPVSHLFNSDKIGCIVFWSRAPWLPTNDGNSGGNGGDGGNGDADSGGVIALPQGPCRVLCARFVPPDVMDAILAEDDIQAARIALVRQWERDGSYHVTDLARPNPSTTSTPASK